MVEAGLGWRLAVVAGRAAAGQRAPGAPGGNTRNELQLPVHILWRKQQPLQQAARLLIEQLAEP
jgi:hypothetical protein